MVMIKFKAWMKTLNPVLFSLRPGYGLEATDRVVKGNVPFWENCVFLVRESPICQSGIPGWLG